LSGLGGVEELGVAVAGGLEFVHACGDDPGAACFGLGGEAGFSGLDECGEDEWDGEGHDADGDDGFDEGGTAG
jgi:hypothetical protein